MWTGEEAGRGRTGAPEWPKTTRFWASTGREQQVMLGPGAAPDGPALPERRMWQASSAGGHARNAYRLRGVLDCAPCGLPDPHVGLAGC